jgi:hypothetical protein
MVTYYGDLAEDATLDVYFNTFTSDDPSASSTITNFAAGDVHIHKDGGLTQRNNAAGITVSIDFDGITGTHLIKIDTSDDTVAAFWVTGSDYMVRIEGTTVDGATLNVAVATFSIENRYNAVTDYDGPTKAEMDTAHALLATEAKLLAYVQLLVRSDAAIEIDNATELTAINADGGSGAGDFSSQLESNEALRDRGDAEWVTATGFNTTTPPTVAQIQAEMEENGASVLDTINDIISASKINAQVKGIDASVIANASFNADVGSTAYATNVIALAVRKVLDELHLDHLLAVTYDPASKPGAADALLNEIVENDGGVSRFTENSLEQAPSGTGASATTIADAVWNEAIADHVSAGSTGEALNDAGGGHYPNG